jgi:hypothetical protein
MLPDMTDTFDEWLSDYTVLTVTKTTLDFVRMDVVVSRTVQAMAQPAQKQHLNPAQVDWSKRYKLVHSPEQLVAGEYIEIDGEDYKIIDDGDYQTYGFTEAIAEQTKQAKLVVT